MNNIITILLILVIVKFVIIGWILLAVFKTDLKAMWHGSETQQASTTPVCMYCQSRWTRAVDDGEVRWDNDDLILVTTYECEHCHMPLWHVDRLETAVRR